MTTATETIIIGAGPAGLSVASCLKTKGLPFVLLEKSQHIGNSWRNHYDRLHLHTDRNNSGLPFLEMPLDYPKYPKRDQVVEYLENYAQHFGIEAKLGEEVVSASFVEESEEWVVKTHQNVWVGKNLVIATSTNGVPTIPNWQGKESFQGDVFHSSEYKNGSKYQGKKVLVVGFGNSGGEIAIDLHEHGAFPSLSVRSAVNIIPKELLGIPILSITQLAMKFPPAWVDFLLSPLLWWMYGKLYKLGLRKLPLGPMKQVLTKGKIPLLDIGTAKLIRRGNIKIQEGIQSSEQNIVTFTNGASEQFDAIVVATGFRPVLERFLQEADKVTDSQGCPTKWGEPTALPGLYFCGFYVSPTGMLRELGIEAQRIAKYIQSKRTSVTQQE